VCEDQSQFVRDQIARIDQTAAELHKIQAALIAHQRSTIEFGSTKLALISLLAGAASVTAMIALLKVFV
jgi:hypothetical protein